MTSQTFRIGALVACATLGFTGGCDRRSSPTAPAEAVTHVLGWVVDPILRPLEATEVPLDPGDYTVMFSFHLPTARDAGRLPPCAGFPADAAKRTFNATVTESPYPDLFDRLVTLEGPTVSRNAQFGLAIGQRTVSFGEMENPITEEMSGFRYLNAQFGPRVPDEPVTVADGKVSGTSHRLFPILRAVWSRENATVSSQRDAIDRMGTALLGEVPRLCLR